MGKTRKKTKSKTSKTNLSNQQLRNQFFKDAQILIDRLSGEKIFHTLSKMHKDLLFLTRIYGMKFNYPSDGKLTKKNKDLIESLFKYFSRTRYFDIPDSNFTLDLHSFTTTWNTISFYVNTVPVEFCKNIEGIREKISKYTSNETILSEGLFLLSETLNEISQYVSRIDKIYEFKYEIDPPERNGLKGRNQYVNIKYYEAKWRRFKINGEYRSAFQFGATVTLKEFKWFTVNAECFDSKSLLGKLPVEVYVQKHAILRFFERVDLIDVGFLVDRIYSTFEEPKIIKFNNRFLLEFELFDIKVGYFLGNLIDGIFVLNTFLFLTNNGTPEGNKFNSLMHVKKHDKDYLKIDKLSTFLEMNSLEAKELKELFENTGITGLFELKRIVEAKALNKKEEENKYQGKIKKFFSFEGDNDLEIEDFGFEVVNEPVEEFA